MKVTMEVLKQAAEDIDQAVETLRGLFEIREFNAVLVLPDEGAVLTVEASDVHEPYVVISELDEPDDHA